VLGGQVIAELDASGALARGYVYAGGTLLAVQQSNSVYWIHEDPVTKSKRTTDENGTIVSTVELDPWGADTNRSGSSAFQPKKFTSYERDSNGSDEAMFRRYNRKHSRFDQPDPYRGSMTIANPQSFNGYAYVQNDPVNFVDPTGLYGPPIGDGDGDGESYGPGDTIYINAPGLFWPRSALGGGRREIAEEDLVDNFVAGGGGGIDPQDTSEQNPYPGCITANWFVNTPQAKAAFADFWQRTQTSGKENGGWFFYEQKTNSLIGKSASEGEKFGMPKELGEFDAQISQFKQNGQSVIFMFDFHTHPGGTGAYSSGDLGNINAFAKREASIHAPGGGHAPIGIVISGPGKVDLYDANGLINKFSGRWNECL
jgi:RHS repeat-associated protein